MNGTGSANKYPSSCFAISKYKLMQFLKGNTGILIFCKIFRDYNRDNTHNNNAKVKNYEMIFA